MPSCNRLILSVFIFYLAGEYTIVHKINGDGLPQWPRYTPKNGGTMMLDDIPVLKNDPDREARESFPIT